MTGRSRSSETWGTSSKAHTFRKKEVLTPQAELSGIRGSLAKELAQYASAGQGK
jgi:hypothetical protein